MNWPIQSLPCTMYNLHTKSTMKQETKTKGGILDVYPKLVPSTKNFLEINLELRFINFG